jgi:hypothetical protein
VKAGTVASFSFGDLIDGKYSRSFNLSTNQWAASGGAPEFTNYTVTPNIDGWFLVSAIYTPTGATGGKNIAFLLNTPVVGQTVSFDTPQIEAGSFPTSYIPTTTGTAVRSADVCSITAGNFTSFYTQSEGTLFAQTQKTSTNSNAFIISVSDNSFNNETDLRYNSVSQVASLMNVSNVNQLVGLQANITSGDAVKQSIAYKLNDCAYAVNGASPISDTSALIPTVDRLTIGNVAVVGQAFYLNGHIAAIRYYRKRLPNAKLQALTA